MIQLHFRTEEVLLICFLFFFSRWQGVKEATKKPNSCVQLRDDFFPDFQGSDIWNPNTKVSEDCLYLNVAVPNGLAYNNASVMASTTMCYLLGRPLNDWTKDKTGIRSSYYYFFVCLFLGMDIRRFLLHGHLNVGRL